MDIESLIALGTAIGGFIIGYVIPRARKVADNISAAEADEIANMLITALADGNMDDNEKRQVILKALQCIRN